MDYKYIEQLIERYWDAETSRQEEQILRAFFSQDEVPEHLARYQELFRYEASAAEEKVSTNFDARILEKLTAATAAELGKQGWVFDLSYPSYSAFMQFSDRPDLRKQCYLAYNSRAYGGENDNSEVCRQIANTRLKIANLLGFSSYAEYALKERMAKNVNAVRSLLD